MQVHTTLPQTRLPRLEHIHGLKWCMQVENSFTLDHIPMVKEGVDENEQNCCAGDWLFEDSTFWKLTVSGVVSVAVFRTWFESAGS